jgi:hypothetical protein
MICVLLNDDGTIKQYPYTITDLRFANSQISFPSFPCNEALKEFNVCYVTETEKPVYDESTQVLINSVKKIDDVWTQVWNIEPIE